MRHTFTSDHIRPFYHIMVVLPQPHISQAISRASYLVSQGSNAALIELLCSGELADQGEKAVTPKEVYTPRPVPSPCHSHRFRSRTRPHSIHKTQRQNP